jgi:ATP-dependent helicase/nuclease subunit A
MSGAVYPLAGAQRDAVDPRESVWLSASAGTGKTQVLSARVLRLLLQEGVEPSDILCLTFTKAGAAEMAVRVNEVLARWVRLPDARLAEELAYLGAPVDAATRSHARSLFASVLDSPGGGLRIDTIHAFAQYLLAAFPEEARIAPGSRPMEDRERELLSEEVLGDLLTGAEASNDRRTLDAIAEMSRRKGADGVRRWLMRCAGAIQLWTGPAGWQAPMHARVCGLLGIPADADEHWVAQACADEGFPVALLRACREGNAQWGTKTGLACVEFVDSWLAAGPIERVALLDGFYGTLLTKTGEPKSLKNLEKLDPDYGGRVAEVVEAIGQVAERRTLVELAGFLAPQLEVGRQFALMWDEAKSREALVDFDDQIRRAAALLADSAMGDWIRYKLDRCFDHILIDEAQDTNADQWAIIFALTDDFFSGLGAQGDAIRTIFTVGDYKQAIFGFQGTSPENFASAQRRVAQDMARLGQGGDIMAGAPEPRRLRDLDLGQSFRTAEPILQFVDKAIASIGPASFGLKRAPEPHVGQDRPGIVTLWNTVSDIRDGDEDGSEGWLAKHDRRMADWIAQQIRGWMDPSGPGFPLVKGEKPGQARRASPGDVMILVRKRRELASLIVARLYTHGVPVAGVDRLRLGAPLAVKDLMAALRFAAQPLDDLNLANLLVSPLGGWTQEELLEHGYRPKQQRLWEHLRQSGDPQVARTVAALREILRRVDFDSPQALLHWLLVGPFDGRRRLVARLGAEANDPIDELLNAANAYASAHTASLQGFIRWFDAGDGELKREAGANRDQVRVMTVHGSKGLQAPIVILADAAIGPDAPGELALVDPTDERNKVPLPGLSSEQRVGPIAAAHEIAARTEMEEHWRLLYVAMTRAEEALFIGGSLGPREAKRGTPHEDSWYARLEPLFAGDPVEDSIWGAQREWGATSTIVPRPAGNAGQAAVDLPAWTESPPPAEARPPRPLSPSGLGEVEGSDPPLPPEHSAIAAQRGVLIHALLERLPAVPVAERAARAGQWLARQAPDLAEADRSEMLDRALAVLDHEEFGDIFAAGALAEVPLAAVVGGEVVVGVADRLLVTPERVTVVDFKTARRPPESLERVPDATLRQMAAYVAALETIYPGREVRAALLYTQTPQLIALPADLLAANKARFSAPQESFALPPVE